MSALTTIFMPVLNEGTDVWRPVSAQGRGVDRFLVTGPMPDGEEWKFHEGSLVRCEMKQFADGSSGLVAVEISN